MKTCTKCGIEKDESEFGKRADCKSGLHSRCKECDKEYKKQWWKENKDKILEKQNQYNKEHKEEHKEYFKEYYLENKAEILEKNKKYREANREKILDQKKQYGKENKEKIKKYQKENREKILEHRNKNEKARLKTDLCYKLKKTLRGRFNIAIRNNAKKGSAIRDLGCTIEEFKKYLENQFYPNMSWENYGGDWEIDHIIPFKDINVLDEEQLKMVLSYTNLRPCWKWANNSRNFYNDDQIDFSSQTPKYFN